MHFTYVAKWYGPHICFLSTRTKRIKIQRTKNGQILHIVTGSALNVEFFVDMSFSPYFGFPLSLSFHHCFVVLPSTNAILYNHPTDSVAK